MVNNKETTKSNWYEEFKQGIEELGLQDVLFVMDKIEQAEGKETQEKVDEINSLIKELTYSDEEKQMIFNKFSDGLATFKHSADAPKFVANKLKRKARLLENRLQRAIPEGFGSYIKRLRKNKGFSLKDLEKMTGISPSYINRIEKGERKAPSYPIIEKLADAFNVDISVLLSIIGVTVESNVQGFAQVIYSNNFTVNGKMVSDKQKEIIVELIEKMDSVNWDESTKHLDTIELVQIINTYKALTKN